MDRYIDSTFIRSFIFKHWYREFVFVYTFIRSFIEIGIDSTFIRSFIEIGIDCTINFVDIQTKIRKPQVPSLDQF